jgi:hydrogenase nickel incorporation protein HypB
VCQDCGCGEVAPRGHESSLIKLEHNVLARNDAIAGRNRTGFAAREVLALNLLSSPGAGKTTLLERTIRDLGRELAILVVEGDQATDHDAQRIRAAGAPAVQINTGAGCHLDAAMVERATAELAPPAGAVVFIENVGNLVCPALFDLGERAKVVVASVTEGEDKPIKYPHAFRAAALILLNKVDLAPHVDFDAERFRRSLATVNPEATLLPVSAKTGEGLSGWYGWLRRMAL